MKLNQSHLGMSVYRMIVDGRIILCEPNYSSPHGEYLGTLICHSGVCARREPNGQTVITHL